VHTADVTTGKVRNAKVMANLIRDEDTAVTATGAMRAEGESAQRKMLAYSGL
jgi:methylmalonyl-CoA mutase cobalamin-binding subunit